MNPSPQPMGAWEWTMIFGLGTLTAIGAFMVCGIVFHTIRDLVARFRMRHATAWIPTSVRMPAIGQNVVVVGSGMVRIAALSCEIGCDPVWSLTSGGEFSARAFTHWLPLPPLADVDE